MRLSDNQIFGYVFGAVYVLLGLVGFVVTAGLEYAATDGNNLIVFGINPFHNIVHIAVGAVLVTGALGGDQVARSFHLVVGVVLIVVAAFGIGLVEIAGGAANIIAVNHPDNALHFFLGVVTLAVAVRGWPKKVPSRTIGASVASAVQQAAEA